VAIAFVISYYALVKPVNVDITGTRPLDARQVGLSKRTSNNENAAMDWYDVTDEYHGRTLDHDGRLSMLPEEWQRELAALWRLEADVNNGGYLQFLCNWGRENYVYASRALKRIGANRMAEIIDRCQSLVDEHFDSEGKTRDELGQLMPNAVIGLNGQTIKEAGSVLPEAVLERIYELSYEFMDYPDDVAALGLQHYGPQIERENKRAKQDRE
jgi:hypothetical protein